MSSPYLIGSMLGATLLALVIVLMVTNDEKQARTIVAILKIAALLVTVLAVVAVGSSNRSDQSAPTVWARRLEQYVSLKHVVERHLEELHDPQHDRRAGRARGCGSSGRAPKGHRHRDRARAARGVATATRTGGICGLDPAIQFWIASG
jgi:hypothetical protein